MNAITRRTFVQTGSSAAAVAAFSSRGAAAGANSTVRVAVLGVNGRGADHINVLRKLPGVEVAVLCDPDAKVLDRGVADLEQATGRKPAGETDLRRVFERKDVDAVSIATPNHWHWEYGNGDVGNQGVHETDLCQWGLEVELPSKVVAMGGKFLWDDDKETPEVLTTGYFYPELNRMIQFEVRHWCTKRRTAPPSATSSTARKATW